LLTIRGCVLGTLTTVFLLPCTAWTQQAPELLDKPAPPKAQQGMGGIAGGLGAAPVYDEQKRPITAGGFVEKGAVVFQDITKTAGLSGWTHKMGTPQKDFIVETNGSGVCLIDYDNDGWLDIYLVNGSTFQALDGCRLRQRRLARYLRK
jgi:hypothetical protein